MKHVMSIILLLGLVLTYSSQALIAQDKGTVINVMNGQRFAERWLHLGPIQSKPLKQRAEDGVSMTGFHNDYLSGEAAAVLELGQTISLPNGDVLKVAPLTISKKGWNTGAVGGRSLPGTTHYFYTELLVDEDQDRYLYADFEGSPQVWINGKKVLSNWRDEHILKARDYGVKVELKKGVNRCLVKVDSKQVWWLARLEFMTLTEYQQEILTGIESLQVTRFDQGVVQVDTWPRSFEALYTWTAELRDGHGTSVAMLKGRTGEEGHLYVKSGQTLLAGEVYLMAISAEALRPELSPLESRKLFALYGDSRSALDRIREQLPAAKLKSGELGNPWSDVYQVAFSWFDRLVESKGMEKSQASLEQLYYAQQLLNGVLAGNNPLREMKGVRIPVWFEWMDKEGQKHWGNYGIYLPVDYDQNLHQAPIIYSLTGGSFRNKVVELKLSGSPQDPAKYDVDRAKVLDDRWITVIPANLGGEWDVQMLEAIHSHVTKHFAHDKRRIYVRGGSLGDLEHGIG